MTSTTKNLFSLQTRRLTKSEGLNSSLPQLTGELWICKTWPMWANYTFLRQWFPNFF